MASRRLDGTEPRQRGTTAGSTAMVQRRREWQGHGKAQPCVEKQQHINEMPRQSNSEETQPMPRCAKAKQSAVRRNTATAKDSWDMRCIATAKDSTVRRCAAAKDGEAKCAAANQGQALRRPGKPRNGIPMNRQTKPLSGSAAEGQTCAARSKAMASHRMVRRRNGKDSPATHRIESQQHSTGKIWQAKEVR